MDSAGNFDPDPLGMVPDPKNTKQKQKACFKVEVRGLPLRRIWSLGTMGMGAWPDSRVVRTSVSSSSSYFYSKLQASYTLILKDSSLGGVPDGADRSKITCYVDIFSKITKNCFREVQNNKIKS